MEALGPPGRRPIAGPDAPLLRAAAAHQERPVGPLRAQRRGPLAAHRAQPLSARASLALEGADNSLPHLNDLGRPQLPFSSIALGFKLFGLHEWAGRLPLALWGLLGVLATYAFVARLFDRRTGRVRGDRARRRCRSTSCRRARCSATCARWPASRWRSAASRWRRSTATRRGRRRLVRAPAVAGDGRRRALVGFESRGGLLGLAVPLARRGPRPGRVARVARRRGRARDAMGDAVGAARSSWASAIAAMAARAIAAPGRQQGPEPVGRARCSTPPSKYPTFDYYVGAIGHALAPWSAFLPFAFGRLLLAPPAPRRAAPRARAREPGARRRCSSAPLWRSSPTAISRPGRSSSPSAARRSARSPARWPSATSSAGRTRRSRWAWARCCSPRCCTTTSTSCPRRPTRPSASPARRSPRASRTPRSTSGGSCSAASRCARSSRGSSGTPSGTPFDPASYAKVLRALREAYDGMLALVYFATIAGAVAGGARRLRRDADARALDAADVVEHPRRRRSTLGGWSRSCRRGAIFGLLFACDVWLWAFGRSQPAVAGSFTRGFEPFERCLARPGRVARTGRDGDASSPDEARVRVVGRAARPRAA